MKLNYKTQIMISVVVILLAHVVSVLLKHWIYISIGYIIDGLLWLIHPVMIKSTTTSKGAVKWVRIAGIILILVGIFTRVRLY